MFAVKPIRAPLALCAPVAVLFLVAGCGQGARAPSPSP